MHPPASNGDVSRLEISFHCWRHPTTGTFSCFKKSSGFEGANITTYTFIVFSEILTLTRCRRPYEAYLPNCIGAYCSIKVVEEKSRCLEFDKQVDFRACMMPLLSQKTTCLKISA